MSSSGSPADSRSHDIPPRRRRRAVSTLTDQQAQRKRDLDRRAQRALRERTKTRIKDLEETLEQMKLSQAQQEKEKEDQIVTLREENRALRSSLANVGRYAMEALAEGLTNLEELALERSAFPMTELTADQGRSFPDGGSDTVPRHASEAITHGSNEHHLANSQGHSSDNVRESVGDCETENEADRDLRPMFSNRCAATPVAVPCPGPSSATYDAGLANIVIDHAVGQIPESAQPREYNTDHAYAALPKHRSATCPLDHILLDFLASRRALKDGDADSELLIGPAYASVGPILDPGVAHVVHPVSRVMAEVLSTFSHVAPPEKAAFMYLMHRTMRWQILPTEETYSLLPYWLRPTAAQVIVPHAAWIDNIPWPCVRDMLIENPNKYPFSEFSDVYSQSVTVNWPYGDTDALSRDEGVLNPIFEKHIRRLSNWTVSRTFQEFYPEMVPAIYYP